MYCRARHCASLDRQGSTCTQQDSNLRPSLIVVAVHCGLREGELLALRWVDVNELGAAKPALLVRRTLTRGEGGRGHVVGETTKSGKDRRVRLSRRAVWPSRYRGRPAMRKRTTSP